MNTLKLQNSIFKILIEAFIFDKTKRSKIKSRWAKNHLQKYIDIAMKKDLVIENVSSNSEHIFWQYWHQGKENAPLLIQKCFESIEKYHPEQKRLILSYKNVADYVEIPSKYYDLVNNGKMSITFFSDVLRVYLLTQYSGGTWIDSTIYLTDRIPESILNSDFFVFQKNPIMDRFEDKMSSFFMHAKGFCKLIQVVKDVFYEYWNENDFLMNYFLIEHLVTMLSSQSIEFKKLWDKMPYFSAGDTGILQAKLFEDFNSNDFETIKHRTNVHKLSYKILNRKSSGHSYYDFLMERLENMTLDGEGLKKGGGF